MKQFHVGTSLDVCYLGLATLTGNILKRIRGTVSVTTREFDVPQSISHITLGTVARSFIALTTEEKFVWSVRTSTPFQAEYIGTQWHVVCSKQSRVVDLLLHFSCGKKLMRVTKRACCKGGDRLSCDYYVQCWYFDCQMTLTPTAKLPLLGCKCKS